MGNVLCMSNLMNKLTRFASSPQGKKLADKAQRYANDPKTKAQVEKAKLKLAEMRGGGSTGGTTGGTQTTPPPGAPDTPGGPTKAA